MEQRSGLRERKKNAMWGRLKATALQMFVERGYENVSVAEIAAAAEVSKATVFNYFPTKEDLVIGGMKHHVEDPARVVRERPRGQTPHAALRDRYLELLEHRAPQTGLSDNPRFLEVQRLLQTTPALMVSAMDYRRRSAVLLAEVLIEEGHPRLTSRLVASQLLHTQHILVEVNVHHILEGEPIDELHQRAVTAAHHAFGLLEHGIGDLMRRDSEPPAPDAAFTPDGCRIGYEPGRAEAEEVLERFMAGPADDVLKALTDPGRR
ncbi:TetR/AcrR family transcriptional regulator [Glycomyces albidus]|jgi:AcrR family transcriptional regulator|uniref:TetR family transcriptional regulator n=1 Tax=Glycomyces albidus TaxID=2656774 RepID=A0A6L5G5C8_9ACTN|nr:TetR/AcrR family transcriptional regulator [Glycomyces albidus]MQM24849.1 TetR family transcriptional regulator [Glycomyces albidus]